MAQLQATLENAKLTTERARTLLGGPAGQQSTYDAAIANQRSLEAQVQSAQAQVKSSQINLDYTDIRSPIDGKIGRTAVTEGNVVSAGFGHADDHRQPGSDVCHLPGLGARGTGVARALCDAGRLQGGGDQGYACRTAASMTRPANSDFVNNTIAQSTDTISLRGVIPNPPLHDPSTTGGPVRELTDGEFVTVMLEGVQPVEVLAIPRSAVLSDQQGDYVFTVGADNKAEQRRISSGSRPPRSPRSSAGWRWATR